LVGYATDGCEPARPVGRACARIRACGVSGSNSCIFQVFGPKRTQISAQPETFQSNIARHDRAGDLSC
jgi:hypothetical protein